MEQVASLKKAKIIRQQQMAQSKTDREYLSKYLYDQGEEFAEAQFPIQTRNKLSQETALLIGEEIWKSQGDIRDVISTSKLVKKDDGPEEIAEIINTLTKYGE